HFIWRFWARKRRSLPTSVESRALPVRRVLGVASRTGCPGAAYAALGLDIFRAARRRFNPDSSHNEKPARSDKPLSSLFALDGPSVDNDLSIVRRCVDESKLCHCFVHPLYEQAAVGHALRIVGDEYDVARADLISGLL